MRLARAANRDRKVSADPPARRVSRGRPARSASSPAWKGASTPVLPNGDSTAFAVCPDGQVALSAGYRLAHAATPIATVIGVDVGNGGARNVQVTARNPGSVNGALVAIAICATAG